MDNKRIANIRNLFGDNSIDALLISNYYNILYLTGFKTLTTDEREAFVLVTKNSVYLFTDARYIHADPNIILKLIEPGKGLLHHLNEIVKKENIKVLGIEAEDLRVHEFLKIKGTMALLNVLPTEKLVVRLRAVKEDIEFENMRKACEITGECLKEIVPTIAIGDTEKEIAFRIESWIKKKEFITAFDPIVAINENSAIPHYNTKEGAGFVKEQSIVLIDFGVTYNSYRSDITRMVFINPTNEMLNTYNALLKVQEKTISIINSVKDAKTIDQFCRKELIENKLPNFPHSLGHGVGLEIHEYPKLSVISTDALKNNEVFTVEPGVYFQDKWGMRIEDTVGIIDQKVEVLTKYGKKLPI